MFDRVNELRRGVVCDVGGADGSLPVVLIFSEFKYFFFGPGFLILFEHDEERQLISDAFGCAFDFSG